MEERTAVIGENVYRWLVLTPLAFIMELLLTAQMLWMGITVTFLEIGKDYQSALISYLDEFMPTKIIGLAFLLLALVNSVALIKRWHLPRAICLVANVAYLLTYVGASLLLRPMALGVGITIALTIVTIIALFKLSNIRVYDSRVH